MIIIGTRPLVPAFVFVSLNGVKPSIERIAEISLERRAPL
jgi:hypothetical protein